MLRRRQIRAIKRAFRQLFKRTWNSVTTVSKNVVDWLLRTVLLIGVGKRRQAHDKAGFVLPTVALLLVVVALVIGSILMRTGSRTNQVINERNQQVIYNAATPAIDRAKAKLEYLFKKDDRLPNTTPSEAQLLSAILNDGNNGITKLDDDKNPYIFKGDETQVQLAGQNAPAWKYETDIDGDGKKETVAYSIILKTQDPNDPNLKRTSNDQKAKANKLVVRNGPITVQKAANPGCERLNLAPESGWDLVGTGSLRKTFQVDAVVVYSKNGNRTISTLEFQQDRELARANKWGAWFRYDLHIYPTPPFRWNGAMHTEGSLYLGPTNADSIQSYLISAPNSCLYNPASNSEITIGRIENNNQISFAGQVANGALGISGRTQNALVHIYGSPPDKTSSTTQINGDSDSVKKEYQEQRQKFAMNPVVLFTKDQSEAIGEKPADPNNNPFKTGIDYSTDKWKTDETLANTRLRANSEDPPYVDDTYRADDRLGPKPKFNLEGKDNDFELNDSNRKNGTPISSAGLNSDQLDQMGRNDPKPNDDERKTIGLDGYWERRARLEGLRIIVGQRLELGNPKGWGVVDFNGDGTDINRASDANEFEPRYPIYKSKLPNPTSHLQQQRRSLRDNLAAVQATAVYHYTQGDSGYFPVACLATTAHPGTQTTIDNSINFSLAGRNSNSNRYYHQYDGNGLISDFFTGRGTNGWEFNIASRSEFQNGGSEIQKALKNLGNFAGEYENSSRSGAFPPTQEGGRVHPDPYLAMWGNFSNLRRAIQDPVTNPVDSQKSIADQSYMHTAGCALGMLAYNVNYFQKYDYTANKANLNTLDTALADLSDTNLANGEIEFTASNIIIRKTGQPDQTISSTQWWPDIFTETLNSGDPQRIARLVAMKEQIARDRKFGFATSPTTPTPNEFKYEVAFHDTDATDPTFPDFKYAGVIYDKSTTADTDTNPLTVRTLNLGCDISNTATGNNYFGFGKPNDAASEKTFIRLAVSLCPTKPKFPSLYYIFPDNSVNNHNRDGSGSQPNTEPYIDRTTGSNNIPINGNFETVNIETIAGQFQPKGSWTLPTGGSASTSTNPDAFKIKNPDNNDLYVPFVDKGVFDGREMLSTRFLDIDLTRLRQNSIGGDNWIPKSGIVYAFREDAVREDAIARPDGGDYTDPNNPVKSDLRNPDNPSDPRVKTNGISPKPVDFYPDPDRRTYGFRLRNGEDLRRGSDNPRGITFISDNPVAILGNFNLHSQEEFIQPLSDDFSNFYDRKDLNANFATTGGDTWRTAEILTDAIYTLSKDFVDGNIEDGLRNNGKMSYRGLGSPDALNSTLWVREDGSASNISASPIKIFRDGNPRRCDNQTSPINYCLPNNQISVEPNAYFRADSRRDNLDAATRTEINAVIIGGTVPARENQGNGGLNNFPRFLENWNGIDLKIRGSFIQLNFSTYATGPYDQEGQDNSNDPRENAFDPDRGTKDPESAFHSRPPNRLWGYDVALQYAPAGPLSKRFITAETPRSEFYEEPKANDPYICNLRLAIADNQEGRESQTQVQDECKQ